MYFNYWDKIYLEVVDGLFELLALDGVRNGGVEATLS